MGWKTGGTHLVRDAHAPVDLHGAGVAALHFREELGRVLLLDHHAAHAAQAEVDRKRQAGGPGSNNENFRIHA